MKLNVLAFGIAKEIFGSSSVQMEVHEGATTEDIRAFLEQQYPRLNQLSSFLVAVNNEYAEAGKILLENDEIAIIPPVSGG